MGYRHTSSSSFFYHSLLIISPSSSRIFVSFLHPIPFIAISFTSGHLLPRSLPYTISPTPPTSLPLVSSFPPMFPSPPWPSGLSPPLSPLATPLGSLLMHYVPFLSFHTFHLSSYTHPSSLSAFFAFCDPPGFSATPLAPQPHTRSFGHHYGLLVIGMAFQPCPSLSAAFLALQPPGITATIIGLLANPSALQPF